MSMLPYLRLRNMGAPEGVDQTDTPYDANQRMSELYHPSTTAIDRYNAEFKNAPNPADYAPSVWRRIGAIGAGLGSNNPYGTAAGIVRAPYDYAKQNYDEGLKPLHDAADLEYRGNTNERILANDVVSREIADRKNDIANREVSRKEARDTETAKLNQEKLEIQRKRAEAYEWAKTHPNYEGRIDKDGKLVYVNKTNPSDIVHTDIDTGKMNDFEKIQANIKGRLSEIAAQGQNQQTLEGQKQTGRIAVTDERARLRPPVVTGTSTTTTLAPDAKSKTVVTNKSFSTPNPPTATTDRGLNKGNPGGSNNAPPNNGGEEMVSVINPQGIRGRIPKSKLAGALKAGYKQVQ